MPHQLVVGLIQSGASEREKKNQSANLMLVITPKYYEKVIISLYYCKSVECIHLAFYFKTLSFSSYFHVAERIFKILIK